jgi:hypothetical protein
MYCTTEEVYFKAGITSSETPVEAVKLFIRESESEVDRFVNNTFWNVEQESTATSATNNTLSDSNRSFTKNAYVGDFVWIYAGTGVGQARKIKSHTSTQFTFYEVWATNPDATSEYRVIHTGTPAYASELFDGSGKADMILSFYPIRILEGLEVDGTTISVSEVFVYGDQGVIRLGNDTELSRFPDRAQKVSVQWWWGIFPMPEIAKSLCRVYAALKALEAQMGGTHNIPSTYSLPEGSVTVGQAYINIRGTYDVLTKERERLESQIVRYASMTY